MPCDLILATDESDRHTQPTYSSLQILFRTAALVLDECERPREREREREGEGERGLPHFQKVVPRFVIMVNRMACQHVKLSSCTLFACIRSRVFLGVDDLNRVVIWVEKDTV